MHLKYVYGMPKSTDSNFIVLYCSVLWHYLLRSICPNINLEKSTVLLRCSTTVVNKFFQLRSIFINPCHAAGKLKNATWKERTKESPAVTD